jgi:hypothetical protein
MRLLLRAILFGVLSGVAFFSSVEGSGLSLDPNIETVSSGPLLSVSETSARRFRLIVVLSEISLSLHVQKLEYGEENCCAKITIQYTISDEDLAGPGGLFSVQDIRWLSDDSIRFRGNSTLYTIRNLGGKYECTKERGQ